MRDRFARLLSVRQIEDIGMSLDEMNKTDKDGARVLANKAKAALQAMIEGVEW